MMLLLLKSYLKMYSHPTGPPKIQPGYTYTLCIRGVNDCGPGQWSQSTVVCFQDDEKEHFGDEETSSSAQDMPNNDIASPRQLQVDDVTDSIGGMSVSSKSPSENPASAITTPSLQAQTYPGVTMSIPLASPIPVEKTLPCPTQNAMPILTTLTQTQPSLVKPIKPPLPSQDDSLQPVPQSTDSPLPSAPVPVPNALLPDTSNSVQADATVTVSGAPIHSTSRSVPEASLPSTTVPSAPILNASVSGAPNPGTSVPLQSTLVPGAPENLRVSTKRTETLIKVRWQPSSNFPEAAACYELEMHPMMSLKVSWKVVATTNKLSAKITHLQPDTSYEFRVQAMNTEGTPGPYSETITGSTKASKGTGGGTGAVSRSAYSGLSKLAASGSSLFGSSKLKGKNPSGVGEYVFGGLSRGIKSAGDYLGNKVKVEDEPISPQSSDDEQ